VKKLHQRGENKARGLLCRRVAVATGMKSSRKGLGMDLGLLMSDQPVRHIKINLLLVRNNVCVSYSLVIFGAGRQHDGKKAANLQH